MADHKLVQLAAKYSSKTKSAWHINDLPNGIKIPSDYHLKGHDIYTNKVKAYMTKLYDNAPGNMEKAYDELTAYTALIKKKIEANPHLTLGEIADLIP